VDSRRSASTLLICQKEKKNKKLKRLDQLSRTIKQKQTNTYDAENQSHDPLRYKVLVFVHNVPSDGKHGLKRDMFVGNRP
jgi:hypothetical protein